MIPAMPQWVSLLQLQKHNCLKQGRTQQATPGTWIDLQTYFKLYTAVFSEVIHQLQKMSNLQKLPVTFGTVIT